MPSAAFHQTDNGPLYLMRCCAWGPTLRPRDPCLLDLRTENRQETLLPGKCQASPASGSMAFPQRTGDPECGVSVQREKEIGFQLIHFSSRLGLH